MDITTLSSDLLLMALYKPKSHISTNRLHPISYIPNISHHKHPTSQTYHIPNIPHPQHPLSQTSHILNTPHFKHLTPWTPYIQNILQPVRNIIWHDKSTRNAAVKLVFASLKVMRIKKFQRKNKWYKIT